MAPTRRVMASSFGKMPTTLVRRLTSPFRRSRGLTEWILVLYCTTVVRQAAASFISCGLIHGRLLVGPDLSRRPVAMAGDQPVGIVPGGEIQQRQAYLFDGLEVAHPQEVFLECTDEALGDAVALGLAHEGRRGLDAEEGDLALEVVGHIVRSVVVPEHEAGGHLLADGAEVPAHTLADRFQGLEAVGALVGGD